MVHISHALSARRTVVGSIAIVYVPLFILIGPLFHPDSGGYVGYADAILKDSGWLHDARVGEAAIPLLIFRTAGYPLVIAAAKLLAGQEWARALVAFQLIASLPALIAVYDLAERVLAPWRSFATAVTVLFGLTIASLYHLSILTDSLYASVFVLVSCRLLCVAWDRSDMTAAALARWGFLLGVSCWLRPAGLYFVPLLLLPAAVVAMGAAGQRSWRTVAGHAAAFLVPLAIALGAYPAWNMYRTGHAVLSTVAQADFIFPVLAMMDQGAPISLPEDNAITQAVQDTGASFDFAGTLKVNDYLYETRGLTCFGVQEAAFDFYTAVVLRYPLIYARYVLGNLARAHARIALDPRYLGNEYTKAVTGRPSSALSNRAMLTRMNHPTYLDLLVMPTAVLLSAISAASTCVFFLLPAILWRRRRVIERRTATMLAYLWCQFWTVAGFYALVRIEARFLIPVLPALLIGMIAGFHLLRYRPAQIAPSTRLDELQSRSPSQSRFKRESIRLLDFRSSAGRPAGTAAR